jgi:hypothetical protein
MQASIDRLLSRLAVAAVGFSGAAAALNSAIYDGGSPILPVTFSICICCFICDLKVFELRLTVVYVCSSSVDGGKRAVMFNRFPNPLSGEVSYH